MYQNVITFEFSLNHIISGDIFRMRSYEVAKIQDSS